ncbi:MAG: hypothetical protein J5828_04960, partial [Desulfovibrionaceae bacterium]|nr:hypothetical protein [Desulfovibrionaceae bacterium]
MNVNKNGAVALYISVENKSPCALPGFPRISPQTCLPRSREVLCGAGHKKGRSRMRRNALFTSNKAETTGQQRGSRHDGSSPKQPGRNREQPD